MSVSGSTDFKSSAAEIIADALGLLGVLAEEEPLPAYDLQRGMRKLTQMLKHWEGLGIGGWLYTEGALSLVSGTASYLFGSGGAITTVPFEVTSARISYNGGSEIPLNRMSRETYRNLPNKTATGFPTNYFYDRQRDDGTMYFWPVPNSSLFTVNHTVRRRIMDIDSQADNFDLPPEWEKAITENLADELVLPYGKAGSDEAKKIAMMAPVSFAVIKAWDTSEEEGSISIVPDDY
jgi:hypothetical protein